MIPGAYLSEKEKIESQIQKLKDEARALQERHRGPAMENILKAMQEYEITPDEINNAWRSAQKTARRGQARTPVPPKYRNPATGQTWSGRGRMPRWLSEAKERGHSRDDFLIK